MRGKFLGANVLKLDMWSSRDLTIFGHERGLTKRDFPQAKLESEINACFLLNEHDDTHFLLR